MRHLNLLSVQLCTSLNTKEDQKACSSNPYLFTEPLLKFLVSIVNVKIDPGTEISNVGIETSKASNENQTTETRLLGNFRVPPISFRSLFD